jgi:hypothetical protein
MTYQITIEKIPGFTESREHFNVYATSDFEAARLADVENRRHGQFSTVIDVTRVARFAASH